MSMDHFYDMDIACAIPRESADDTPQVASFRHVATTAIDQMFLTHGIRLIGMHVTEEWHPRESIESPGMPTDSYHLDLVVDCVGGCTLSTGSGLNRQLDMYKDAVVVTLACNYPELAEKTTVRVRGYVDLNKVWCGTGP